MNFDALNVIQKLNAKAYSGKHKHYLEYLATLVSVSVVVTIQLFITLSFLVRGVPALLNSRGYLEGDRTYY
jgi:hypothetical protein